MPTARRLGPRRGPLGGEHAAALAGPFKPATLSISRRKLP
jgi:hypothetical protein